MTNATPADRVRHIIQNILLVDEAPDTAHLIRDLCADSFEVVELVIALEEEFGIEIPDKDMELLGTVGEAIALVEQMIA